MEIKFKPIGYIESEYNLENKPPRQSKFNEDEKKGYIRMEPEYIDGLLGLKAGDHIVISFYFHLSKGYKLHFNHHGSGEIRGVFASRSPNRPNGIGLSICKITRIDDQGIEFEGVDMLDGSPVLDIKIYSEELNPA